MQRNGSPKHKIKVLFFTSRLGNGGAEMHLLRVINQLDRNLFCLSLALTRGGGTYESELAGDVELYHLPNWNVDSSMLRMISSVRPLRQLIKQAKPDIVFSVMDYANVTSIFATGNLAKRPKLVLSIQNSLKNLYGGSWHPAKNLMLSLIPRYYPIADRIIALSEGVADELTDMVPEVIERTEVIYNAGLDEKVLARRFDPIGEEELPSNSPLIVSCGRLDRQKGFTYLLEAMIRVREETNAHLLIVGEGPLRPRLEQQIERTGLQDCVTLLGFRENPFKFMAAADLFVLSSLFEGFGNVLVEAMACGAPVVSTSCPYGPREIIQNGINGLLVPLADPTALAEAMIRVLNDGDLKKRLSEGGKERANCFSAQVIAKNLEGMLLRLMAAPTAFSRSRVNESLK